MTKEEFEKIFSTKDWIYNEITVIYDNEECVIVDYDRKEGLIALKKGECMWLSDNWVRFENVELI